MEDKAFTKRVERFLNNKGLEFTEWRGQADVLVRGVEYHVCRLKFREWVVSCNGILTVLVGSDELIDFFDSRI